MAQMVVGSSPGLARTSTNACRHICKNVDQKGLASMLTSIQSVGFTPEVNLKITQVRKHAEGSTLALKPRADVTRSPKQRYQWSLEKDLRPQNIFKKKKYWMLGKTFPLPLMIAPFDNHLFLQQKTLDVVNYS